LIVLIFIVDLITILINIAKRLNYKINIISDITNFFHILFQQQLTVTLLAEWANNQGIMLYNI